jgi:signal peptidase I
MSKIKDFLKKYIEKYKAFKETSVGEIVDTVLFVLVMVIVIRFFIVDIRWIPSGSMKPTLIEGDRIAVERISRFFAPPKRGDIMVFYPPSTQLSRKPIQLFSRLTGILCKDVAYIKRVVGLPGDKIEIKEESSGAAYVYINDKKYEESYIKSVYEYPACPQDDTKVIYASAEGMQCGPFYLKDDQYFMMGDNRGESYDSRYWGTISRDRFVGRAVVIFFPFNRVKILHRLK